jgi:chemotaxis protein methyltransferase CheR
MEVSEISTRILAGLLQARTGQELPESRRWRIGSALSGLFREHGITSVDQLIAMLTQAREASLARKVVEALLNNETYFFRDRQMFDLIGLRALPELARRRQEQRKLSIWSVGCSTGQEALSLAMMLADQDAAWAGWTFDILATDVSESVIELARQGCYSQFQVQRGLSVSQMIKWFDESPKGWQAQAKLRRMVRFEVHNLLEPLPGAPSFDLILCRNVLLYFDAANRARAFDRLASALAPDGLLMLGVGETVIGQTERFVPDPAMLGLYRQSAAVPPRQARAVAVG